MEAKDRDEDEGSLCLENTGRTLYLWCQSITELESKILKLKGSRKRKLFHIEEALSFSKCQLKELLHYDPPFSLLIQIEYQKIYWEVRYMYCTLTMYRTRTIKLYLNFRQYPKNILNVGLMRLQRRGSPIVALHSFVKLALTVPVSSFRGTTGGGCWGRARPLSKLLSCALEYIKSSFVPGAELQ